MCFIRQEEPRSSGSSSRSRNRPGTGSDDIHIGNYKLLKTIGKGNFAKVKLAKHTPTDKEVLTKSFVYSKHLYFEPMSHIFERKTAVAASVLL